MADPAVVAIGKLDGRDASLPPPQKVSFAGSGDVPSWRPVTLYRNVTDSHDVNVPRKSSAVGAPWNTPSTLDEITVLAEIFTVIYTDPNGVKWTGMDILIEILKALKGFK